MGCYWNCDCTFKADSSSHQTIKDRMIAIWGDAQHCIFESGVDEFTVSYYDHSFYSLG